MLQHLSTHAYCNEIALHHLAKRNAEQGTWARAVAPPVTIQEYCWPTCPWVNLIIFPYVTGLCTPSPYPTRIRFSVNQAVAGSINTILFFQLSQTFTVSLTEISRGVQNFPIRPIQLFHHYGKNRIRRGIHLAPVRVTVRCQRPGDFLTRLQATGNAVIELVFMPCLLYTSPSPRDS